MYLLLFVYLLVHVRVMTCSGRHPSFDHEVKARSAQPTGLLVEQARAPVLHTEAIHVANYCCINPSTALQPARWRMLRGSTFHLDHRGKMQKS